MAGTKSKKKNKAAAVITFSSDLFCTYYSTVSFQFTAGGQKKRVEKWPLEFVEFKERF